MPSQIGLFGDKAGSHPADCMIPNSHSLHYFFLAASNSHQQSAALNNVENSALEFILAGVGTNARPLACVG
jgi:hypothetical protein